MTYLLSTSFVHSAIYKNMNSMVNAVMMTVVIWSLAQGKSSASSWSMQDLSAPPDPNDAKEVNYRLPDNVFPNSYKIKLIPDLDGEHFTFSGQSEIDIRVRKPTRNITLHAKYLNIDDSIQLKCHPENSSQISYFNVSRKSIDNITDFLTIFIEEELTVGSSCILTLSYSSTNQSSRVREGFFESLYSENGTIKRMVSTEFEAIHARRAFPCWDEPAFKANFTISIEHNKKYVALSNMHVERNEENSQDSSRTTTHFAQTPKMSTYIVAFAIGDFATAIENDTGDLRVWAPKSISYKGLYVQEIIPKLLKLLENYLNSTYKGQGFEKLDIIAIPNLKSNSAMENWGLITMSETIFGTNESNLAMANERQAILMAHELAHQWFGNLVTPSRWSSVWLSEGFATYFGNIIADQFKPEWRLRDWFAAETLQAEAFVKDNGALDYALNRELTGPIQEKDIFNTINYSKAACIIRMISNIIGEGNFQSRLRQYVKTYAFQSVEPKHLMWSLCNNDPDFCSLMWNWMTIPGYPVITVTRDYVVETATIMQWRYFDSYRKSHIEKYFIPLNYVTENQLDFNNTEFTHFLMPQWSLLPIYNLKRDQFVIFNKQQFGYYRVNYDERNWRMIAEYLKIKDHTNIHVINRAQLIDDAFHLATFNQLKFDIALSLIGYLKKETDFVVWYALWRSIQQSFENVRASGYIEEFKRYINHLSEHSTESLLSVDVHQNDHVTEHRRELILFWACKMGSIPCKLEASNKFNQWLNVSSKNPSEPLPRDWILCEGGRNASQEALDPLWNGYLNRNEKAIFSALACTSNAVLGKYFARTIANSSNELEHFSSVLKFIIPLASVKTKTFILDFVMQYYEEISTIEGYSEDKLKSDLELLGERLQNESQVNKLVTFLKTKGSAMDLVTENILRKFQTVRGIITERSKEFKEFFEKDLYYKSLHTDMNMENENMEQLNSISSVISTDISSTHKMT